LAGRPRTFDRDAALEAAMHTFWRKGYGGASLADLTKAMHINAPSLYAAFGSKDGLYRMALDRYERGPAAYGAQALGKPRIREAVRALLYGALDVSTNNKHPGGCLLVQGILVSGKAADPLRKEMNRRRAAGVRIVQKRLELAKKQRELPRDSDPSMLARHLIIVIRGLAVEAASGATRAQLKKVIDAVLRDWPPGLKKRKGVRPRSSSSPSPREYSRSRHR
jgi:AcrR family transcriptional regulator